MSARRRVTIALAAAGLLGLRSSVRVAVRRLRRRQARPRNLPRKQRRPWYQSPASVEHRFKAA
jgi:hypothetical protein